MARPVVPEDSALIANLRDISKAKPKLIKSSAYPAPADASITVRSWKMDDFRYYDVPSLFPTLARGIFTVDVPKTDDTEEQQYRIVARGYDKFFQISEVPWTTWEALEAHTTAPYTLTLKSDGCIIFIAALTPAKLLITSKHSIGPIAQAGEGWLRKYFERLAKTEAQLATRLYENNWTAIAELCDDSFKEHVLGYPADKTGLHLHGLNESTKAFKTLPQAQVDTFAAEWGFIQTASIVLPTLAAVRAFTDEVSTAGAWNGEPVEGFVVRTHIAASPPANTKGQSPYAPGSTFFFKVKFDEPYMMYRDWREVTKKLLHMHEDSIMSETALPRGKMKRAETRVYVRWLMAEILRDARDFAEYNNGKGIIAARERFLAYLATPEGAAVFETAKAGEMIAAAPGPAAPGGEVRFEKTIIVPVAIPGCGKTALSVALAHIFDFGHTQSYDVRTEKPAPTFIGNVTALLRTHDVVIADKNNHLQEHREQLRTATRGCVRLLALNWAVDALAAEKVRRVCGERVTRRGVNHQTLCAGAHADIIWRFIGSAEPLAPAEVDAVVTMDVEEGLEEAVARAVAGCVRELGVPAPSAAKVKEGVERAKGYALAGVWEAEQGSQQCVDGRQEIV
ncbi:RNA ligase-domain-containing protein [Mycena sp. CBHHK59/15]|nr:RNA ligase-domain-containing protein [Mycena sp. CBHHK59/15]